MSTDTQSQNAIYEKLGAIEATQNAILRELTQHRDALEKDIDGLDKRLITVEGQVSKNRLTLALMTATSGSVGAAITAIVSKLGGGS